ncbi:hypothetical protein LEMLEM_LOCUS16876 [Lemmus lemmus]
MEIRLGTGRSQLERPEGGPARAERHRLSQAPNARCRWQVGGAAATAAGETRVWRHFAASGSPFPPLSPSPDLEKAKGNSRCARTREQRSIPVPLHYFVFNEEGCAWGLGTGSERRRRGRLLLSRISRSQVYPDREPVFIIDSFLPCSVPSNTHHRNISAMCRSLPRHSFLSRCWQIHSHPVTPANTTPAQ